MAVCFELLLKSFIFMTVLSISLLLFRKRSAGFRHFLLSISFFCLLLMVVLSLWGPRWENGMVNILQDKLSSKDQQVGMIHWSQQEIPLRLAEEDQVIGESQAVTPPPITTFPGGSGLGGKSILSYFSKIFIWIWGTGIVLLMVRFFFGLVHAARLTREGIAVSSAPVDRLFKRLKKRFNIKREIGLIKHREVNVPMTWGMINPVILLPADSCGWAKEQYETVLLHELSHIKRWDFLIMILSRLSCILFWCNPFIWFALKHLKREQEKACDEMVLNAGIRPSTYASFLLAMKRSMDRRLFATSAALGMAGFSEIHDRLDAILKKNKPKKEVGMKLKIIISVIVIVVVALVATAKPVHPVSLEGHGDVFLSQDNDSGQEKTVQKSQEKKAVKEEKKKKKVKTITIETVKKDETLGLKKKKVKTIELDGKSHQTKKFVLDGDYLVTLIEGEEPDRTVKKLKGKPGDDKLTIMIRDNKIFVMREDKEHKLLHKEKIGSEEHKTDIWISKDGKHDEMIQVIEPFHVMGLKHSELKEKVAELEESIKKLKETEIKSQEDVLKTMEKSLEEMKKDLEHSSLKMKKIHRMPHRIIKKIDGDKMDIHISEDDLIKIDEDLMLIKEDDDVFHIKKVDDEVIVTMKGKMPKGKGFQSVDVFKSDVKLDRLKVNKLKIHVADLKKKLPKGYEVELKIGEKSMHVKITSDGKKFEKKANKKAEKIIDDFSKKLDDILPNLTRKRNVYIKK